MKGGSWAQYVVATAEKLVRMPDPMTFEEALDALVESETKHVRGKLGVSMKNI